MPNPEQTRSFPVASQPRKPFCSLCQGNHLPSKCPKYNNPQARKDRLQEQNRCINCLKEGHRAMDCQNNRRCSNCHGRHHFLVCFSRANKPKSRPKMLEFNQRSSFQSRPPAPVFKPRRPTQAHPIWERQNEPPMPNYERKEEPTKQGPKENSVVSTVMNDQNKPKAGMSEAKKLLDEKTKALQEKDRKIAKLISELMLARRKSEEESKKAKRLKVLLDKTNLRKNGDINPKKIDDRKGILKQTRVRINSLQKTNRELLDKNGQQLERLEPPDFYALCCPWMDIKMFMIVFAAFAMILDGAKDALRMFIRATNKLWKCKPNERMEKELTLETRSWLSLTLFATVVAINPSWIFPAIFVNVMNGWAHEWKESRKGAMDDVPKIKKRKKILERWKKEIEDETLEAARNVAKRLKMRKIK
uniref:CCHC-type domain-containing protein n=2 Tax=Meloidogyne incognita group TaxID=654580 RepID=A0A914ME89_MELIC